MGYTYSYTGINPLLGHKQIGNTAKKNDDEPMNHQIQRKAIWPSDLDIKLDALDYLGESA